MPAAGPPGLVGGLGDPVAEDGPAVGRGDAQLEDGLEVGLVEGGEDALDVFHEELGVDVCLAVGGVGEAVHALTGAGVPHVGLDTQLVLPRVESGEREPVAAETGGVECPSVEGDGAQRGGLEFDEGVSDGPCGELDDGTGVEGVLAGGQIEGDRVPVDIDELGSGLRFVARQYGHGGHAARWGAGRTVGIFPLSAHAPRALLAMGAPELSATGAGRGRSGV